MGRDLSEGKKLMSESDGLDRHPRATKRSQLLSHYGITVPQTAQLKKLEPLDIGNPAF